MLSLTIQIEDQLLKAVATKAEELGVTAEAFAIDALRAATAGDARPLPAVSGERKYDNPMIVVFKRIAEMKIGQLFTLNGSYSGTIRIFSIDEWSALRRQDGFSPNNFGKHFRKYVLRYNDIHSPFAGIHSKTPDNKQVYKKIGASVPKNL